MWIEILLNGKYINFPESRPARALWIEIEVRDSIPGGTRVEAREGLVD